MSFTTALNGEWGVWVFSEYPRLETWYAHESLDDLLWIHRIFAAAKLPPEGDET